MLDPIKIGTLVLGYNKTIQRNTNLSKANNQNFVNISYGKLQHKLKYLCELNTIQYIEQEESYTSKAIPVYSIKICQQYAFGGERIHRGMYKRKNVKFLNAEINGALNVLRKSNVVSLNALYNRGEAVH